MDEETVAESILNLLNYETDCDITFIVGQAKERISCHQFLLKARSPVFKVMFSERWKSEQEIQITDVEPFMFRQFLQFVYGDLFTTKISEAIKLHYVANKYQVTPLLQKCEILMKEKIQLNDAIQVYQAVVQYNVSHLCHLKVLAGNIIARGLSELIDDSSFLLMDENTLIDLLPRDDLLVDELKLFQALLNWSCFKLGCDTPDPSDQRNVLEKILPHIRFPLIKSREFAMKVIPKNILNQTEAIAIFTYLDHEPLTRIELEDKLGFSCKSRSQLFSISDGTLQFYEVDEELLLFAPASVDFDKISDHVDIVKFSTYWQNHTGLTSKLRKASIKSIVLRGPDYSRLSDSKYSFSSWVYSLSHWNVSLKLERFSVPIGSTQSCNSFVQRNIEICGNKNTEVKIQPEFVLEEGCECRISIYYSSDIWLPNEGCGHNHMNQNCIYSTRIKENVTWKNNEGILELENIGLCDPNALDEYNLQNCNGGRGPLPFYTSHCVRALKLNVLCMH